MTPRRLLLPLFLCLVWFSALAQAQDYVVQNYDVEMTLNKKGTFDVVERLDVVFQEPRHGIIRDIITRYDFADAEGKVSERNITLSKVKVPKHKVKENSRLQRRKHGLHSVRIGHPKKQVSGEQHYEIRYRVHNGFLFEEDHVAFYWNVKADQWNAPFERVNFTIRAPKGVDIPQDQTFVYAGYNDTEPSEDFDYTWENNTFRATSKEGFRSTEGESVTALVRLPEDSIKDAGIKWPSWFRYLSYIFGPFMLLGYLFTWLRFGRNERSVKVTTYYPPDDMSPSMAGYLLRGKAAPNDILALIPKWGGQGLLEIEETEQRVLLRKRKDIVLHKRAELPDDAVNYERTIFNALFPGDRTQVRISSLKNVFHTHMEHAQKQLHTASNVYYDSTSNHLRVGFPIGMGVLGALLTWFSLQWFGEAQAMVVGACTAAIVALSGTLRKRNARGVEVYGELQGFREFVKLADRDRIAMLVEQDPNYFEKTMSYAMAFNLLEKWAAKFDALNIPPPDWYRSTGSAMSMNNFARSFSSNMNQARSTMVSSPSSSSSSSGSSGGGRAGGGFGGGGGRSW